MENWSKKSEVQSWKILKFEWSQQLVFEPTVLSSQKVSENINQDFKEEEEACVC